ncbi:MAG TPA: hypothetical protein VFN09_09230 [Rhodanobacteraceae bacterium]|nr:hypothetical protein [Rhodanobacteraceae bacterium]
MRQGVRAVAERHRFPSLTSGTSRTTRAVVRDPAPSMAGVAASAPAHQHHDMRQGIRPVAERHRFPSLTSGTSRTTRAVVRDPAPSMAGVAGSAPAP